MIPATARIGQYRKPNECKASSYHGRCTADSFSSGAKETAAVGAEIVEDNRPNVYSKLKYIPMNDV
jgi:hypothetical protein